MTRTSRLMIPILLLALALRLYLLADAPVWWDEGWTVWLIRHPPTLIPTLAARDVHPPFYFMLLWLWRQLAGETVFALRFFSVAGGVLIVALVYRLGTDWLDRRTGLVAATLVALARFAVWWSQEMRMYTLTMAFGLITLLAAVRWYRSGKWNAALYIICTVLNLYTFYLSALYPLVANLWIGIVVWRREERRSFLGQWLAAQLAVLALFAPWLITTLRGRGSWAVAKPFDAAAFLRLFWTLFMIGVPAELARWAGTVAILLLLFLIGLLGLLLRHRRRRGIALLLTLGILVPPAIVYVLSTTPALRFLYAPQVQARYLSLFLPAFYLFFAWGMVVWLRVRPVGTLAGGAMIALAIALPLPALANYYAARRPVDRYQSLTATIHAFRLPGEPVVLHTDRDWPVFESGAALPDGAWHGIPYGTRVSGELAEQMLTPLWKESDGVWLVTNDDAVRTDPQNEIAGWLAARAAWQVQFHYELATLTLYARDGDRLRPPLLPPGQGEPQVPLSAADEGLLGYDLPVRRAYAGDTIYLALYWQGPVQADPVRVTLQQADGAERLLGTETRPATGAAQRARTQHALALPADLPAGTYRLGLVWPDGRAALGLLRVDRRPQQAAAAPASPSHPLDTRFGPALRLTGYDLPVTTARPGGTIPLTLYWQTTKPVEGSYKVFVHLLGTAYNADQQNFLWGQQDVEPLQGEPPLRAWLPGQTMADVYQLPVQPDAPPGPYHIEIGLYDPLSGARLPAYDKAGNLLGDSLVLDRVQIVSVTGTSSPYLFAAGTRRA